MGVTYRQAFPRIKYFTSEAGRLITALGTKAEAWKHDKEWRIVLVGRTGAMWIPPEMITGIIFGMRIAPDRESTIREWCGEHIGPPLELQRVVHKEGSFELALVPA